MKKIRLNMNQEKLTTLAVQKMKEVFPEEDWQESTYVRKANGAICEADSRYIYFSAPSYFKDEFVDAKMINKLQKGASMLSVGVGEGHLERLLSLGFQIPKNQITITDYPSVHPKIKESGFKEYVFDMTKEWPDFKENFDYVLFPESLGVATMDLGEEMCYRFFEDTIRINKLCKERRFDDFENSEAEFFIGLMEKDVPVVKVRYAIICNALKVLNPGGEIRISHGIKLPQQPAYMQLRLKKDGVNVSYPAGKYSHYFFIKK